MNLTEFKDKIRSYVSGNFGFCSGPSRTQLKEEMYGKTKLDSIFYEDKGKYYVNVMKF